MPPIRPSFMGCTAANGQSGFNSWRREAPDVADQWETVERCSGSLQELSDLFEGPTNQYPVDLPEHIRSVVLETARLVESFLKWGLSAWFVTESNLLELPKKLHAMSISDIDGYVGQILGKDADENSFTLLELLRDKLGFMPDNSVEIVDKLLGDYVKLNKHNSVPNRPERIWTNRHASILSLIASIAIAAKYHMNHPFRHIEREFLANAISNLWTAYNLRSTQGIAHFAREQDRWVSSGEAIFWADCSMRSVDGLMTRCIQIKNKFENGE